MSDHEKIKQSLNEYVFNKSHQQRLVIKPKVKSLLFPRILSISFFTVLVLALGVYAFGLLNGSTAPEIRNGPLAISGEHTPATFKPLKNDRFNQLISNLERFDLKLEGVSEPYTGSLDGKSREMITIKTNLGDLIVTDFGSDIPPIIDSRKYAYTNYNHLLIGTLFSNSSDLHAMTEAIADLSQVKNHDLSITPTFQLPYKTNEGKDASYTLRGIEGKVAFLDSPIEENGVIKDTMLVAGKPNKYMWYFWGDSNKYSTPAFSVIGVHQETGKIEPALVAASGSPNWSKIWQVDIPSYSHYEKDIYYMPTEMELSKPGKWALHVFVAGIYETTIVVDVREK